MGNVTLFLTENCEKIFTALNFLYLILILLMLLSVTIALFLKKSAEEDEYSHYLYIKKWCFGWSIVWIILGLILVYCNMINWLLFACGFCVLILISIDALNKKVLFAKEKLTREKNETTDNGFFLSAKIISRHTVNLEEKLPLSI